MQPVLIYETPTRREHTSWRSWGAIQTEADAEQEQALIRRQLAEMQAVADFPLDVLPVKRCKTVAQAKEIVTGDHDGVLLYAAGGWLDLQEQLTDPKKWNLMFVRHRSGPVYLWYEIAHNRYLRKTVDEFGQPGMDVMDVVVDNHDEVLWRLRALAGLKNTLGKKILAIGGPSGWGEGGRQAPELARRQFGMELVDVSYEELARLIEKAQADTGLVERCRQAADDYLASPDVSLETDRDFVERAFVLTEVFKHLMDAAATDAITVNHCMGTIMGMSQTTACMPLSLLNDEGYLAFCESDFVVIPSGVLLHYIAGKPVFLNDPTYPYEGTVTLAHCTAPRKLDGRTPEKVRILTHFESDYGAAPKVEMRLGQTLTNLIPDFNSRRWVGFRGTVKANPFLDICRSQIDVAIEGDTETLLREMKGFHWMTCYGDYRRETGYALKKVGIDWLDLSHRT
ncbi:MAG: sugar isomerase [Verrucomicrobiales bacterium]|nr:sugar isomerase [Verrucomicrobiales bacterium]